MESRAATACAMPIADPDEERRRRRSWAGRVGLVAGALLYLVEDLTRNPLPHPGRRLQLFSSEVAQLRPEGLPWNLRGLLVIGRPGVEIRFPGPVEAGFLEVSCDSNDEYAVIARRGGRPVGETRIPPRSATGVRLRIEQIDLTGTLGGQAYDTLSIEPHGGDGLYFIGHVRPL